MSNLITRWTLAVLLAGATMVLGASTARATNYYYIESWLQLGTTGCTYDSNCNPVFAYVTTNQAWCNVTSPGSTTYAYCGNTQPTSMTVAVAYWSGGQAVTDCSSTTTTWTNFVSCQTASKNSSCQACGTNLTAEGEGFTQ